MVVVVDKNREEVVAVVVVAVDMNMERVVVIEIQQNFVKVLKEKKSHDFQDSKHHPIQHLQ